jgi:hypothetical protein
MPFPGNLKIYSSNHSGGILHPHNINILSVPVSTLTFSSLFPWFLFRPSDARIPNLGTLGANFWLLAQCKNCWEIISDESVLNSHANLCSTHQLGGAVPLAARDSMTRKRSSVPDPGHFGVDQDPRIHASD